MDKPPPEKFQPVTDEIRAAVRKLVAAADHAALATLEPGTGDPQCTRVGLATLADGTPLILVSGLAAHTPALAADPRCSLLIGEPGKGDPLAHPRLTLFCRAEVLAGAALEPARTRYLASHSKAGLYVDLPDFRFIALRVLRGSYNGGFGRASLLAAEDIIGG